MKKIIFDMRDKYYQRVLSDALNEKYDDIDSDIVQNIDGLENDGILFITDSNKNYKSSLILDEDNKYQSIDKIYDLIEDSFIKNKLKKSYITFLLSIDSDNYKILFDVAKEKSLYKDILLVDWNYFQHNKDDISEICLDSLMLMDNEIDELIVNEVDKLKYISSTKLPLSLQEQKNYSNIIRILKDSGFDEVLIYFNFYITKQNIDLLEHADRIIFIYDKDIDNYYKSKTINFITSKLNENIKIEYIKIHQNSFSFKNSNSLVSSNINIKELGKVL